MLLYIHLYKIHFTAKQKCNLHKTFTIEPKNKKSPMKNEEEETTCFHLYFD